MRAETFVERFPQVTQVNNNYLQDLACTRCGDRGPFDIECTAFFNVGDVKGIGHMPTTTPDWMPDNKIKCLKCGCQSTISTFDVQGLDSHLTNLEEARRKAERKGN